MVKCIQNIQPKNDVCHTTASAGDNPVTERISPIISCCDK